MQNIPKGLVATSAGTPSRFEGSARLDEDDIAKLWKVYGTSTSIHKDHIGHRLENYFWRVWGNTRLLKSLEGSVLASLFTSIVTATPVSTHESALLELEKMALMLNNEGDENGHPSILKKPNSKNKHGSLQKRTRIFVGGLGERQIRKPSSPLTPCSPPPFAATSGDAAGDDPADDIAAGYRATGDMAVGDSGSGDSIAEVSPAGSLTIGNLDSGISPAENTATGNSTGGSKGSRSGHRRTTLPQHHQKRTPVFVAPVAKRRPVMPRRKSSKTAGPSKLRSEVRFDPEDVSAKNSKHGQDAEKEDKPEPVEQPETPLAETEAQTHVPEQKQVDVNDADQKPQDETTAPDFMSNLKHILTQSAIQTNSKVVPRQTFHCVSTRRYAQGARNMPVKLVDDHFRLRFAQEIQREESMLKEIESLPAEERKAVQARSISALTGQLLPKKPLTTWVVVSDEEAEREALNASSGNVNNTDHDNKRPVNAVPTATNDKISTSTWKDDGAQGYSLGMQMIVVPKIEGMSYVSSVRAATRLHAPGQLSILLRAKQYGQLSGGKLYPE